MAVTYLSRVTERATGLFDTDSKLPRPFCHRVRSIRNEYSLGLCLRIEYISRYEVAHAETKGVKNREVTTENVSGLTQGREEETPPRRRSGLFPR